MPFRFDGLPAELRVHIYSYLLTSPWPLNPFRKGLLCTGFFVDHKYEARGKDHNTWLPPLFNSNILFANKKIYREAVYHLYSTNIFDFSHPRDLEYSGFSSPYPHHSIHHYFFAKIGSQNAKLIRSASLSVPDLWLKKHSEEIYIRNQHFYSYISEIEKTVAANCPNLKELVFPLDTKWDLFGRELLIYEHEDFIFMDYGKATTKPIAGEKLKFLGEYFKKLLPQLEELNFEPEEGWEEKFWEDEDNVEINYIHDAVYESMMNEYWGDEEKNATVEGGYWADYVRDRSHQEDEWCDEWKKFAPPESWHAEYAKIKEQEAVDQGAPKRRTTPIPQQGNAQQQSESTVLSLTQEIAANAAEEEKGEEGEEGFVEDEEVARLMKEHGWGTSRWIYGPTFPRGLARYRWSESQVGSGYFADRWRNAYR